MPRNIRVLIPYAILGLLCLWGMHSLRSICSTLSPIDLASLNVQTLKALLDQKWDSYRILGDLGHGELVQLVTSPGNTSKETATNALSFIEKFIASDKDLTGFANFTSGKHFCKDVEDSRDDVWIVRIHSVTTKSAMNPTEWKKIVRAASKYQIKIGHFDCSVDRRFCSSRDWSDSRLILVLPFRKQNNVYKSFIINSALTAKIATEWVTSELAASIPKIPKIAKINSWEMLKKRWLHFDEKQFDSNYVRVILVSNLDTPPPLFSALSTAFAGRIRLIRGMIDVGRYDGKAMAKELNSQPYTAAYLIITTEISNSYGYQIGEILSNESMAFQLRILKPKMVDIIIFFFILACCLAFVLLRGYLKVLKACVSILFTLLIFIQQFGLSAHLISFSSHLLSIRKMSSLYFLLIYPRICFTSFAALAYDSHVCRVLAAILVISVITKVLCIGIMHTGFGLINSVHNNDSSNSTTTVDSRSRSQLTATQATAINRQAPLSPASLFITSSGSRPTENNTNNNYFDYIRLSNIAAGNGRHDIRGTNDIRVVRSLDVVNESIRNFLQNRERESFLDQVMIHTPPLNAVRTVRHTDNLRTFKYSGVTGNSYQNDDNKLIDFSKEEKDSSDGAAASAGAVGVSPNHASLRPICWTCLTKESYEGKTERELGDERLKLESAGINLGTDDVDCCIRCGDIVWSDDETHTQCRSATNHTAKGSQFESESDRTVGKSTNPSSRTPEGMIVSVSCTICTMDYMISDKLCGLPCHHSFHQHCIMRWLTECNCMCPICRWPADEDKPQNDLHSSR